MFDGTSMGHASLNGSTRLSVPEVPQAIDAPQPKQGCWRCTSTREESWIPYRGQYSIHRDSVRVHEVSLDPSLEKQAGASSPGAATRLTGLGSSPYPFAPALLLSSGISFHTTIIIITNTHLRVYPYMLSDHS